MKRDVIELNLAAGNLQKHEKLKNSKIGKQNEIISRQVHVLDFFSSC